MFSVNVRADVKQVERMLTDLQKKQIPFATALALTRTAQDVQAEVQASMDKQLDRPTPFTKRGVAIKRATKSKLVSEVFIKPIQAGYLGYQIEGGTRHPKGKAVVVPVGTRKNKYGNMPKGALKRLLARNDTFSGEVKGIPGIWQRTRSGGVKLLIAYERKVEYTDKPFTFQVTAERKARERFPIRFDEAMASALRSAR